MARSFLCIPCSMEFPSDAIYQAHKLSGHKSNLDQGQALDVSPIPAPPLGVPPEALPSPEFIEQVKRIEGEDKSAQEASKPSQHPSELPKAVPLQLTYQWLGEHEKCRRQPSTLKLEVGGKFFSVAYCESCKEQLESKEVVKL